MRGEYSGCASSIFLFVLVNEKFHCFNLFPHTTILQQTTLNVFCQNTEIEWITFDKKWKTLWQKEKLHVLCNFFFCHYVFKKQSAAEASESVYMRVKPYQHTANLQQTILKTS